MEDVKAVLRVAWIFLPLPIFWSLFFQTYSTWVMQAKQMDKVIAGYAFCPDQTQTLNPFMDMVCTRACSFRTVPETRSRVLNAATAVDPYFQLRRFSHRSQAWFQGMPLLFALCPLK